MFRQISLEFIYNTLKTELFKKKNNNLSQISSIPK